MLGIDRLSRRIKLQDLGILKAVVEAGSMRKAASALNSTQPSVSRCVADLEKALGVKLLERHAHGVEATIYGRALIDGGAAMLDDLRQTLKKIEFLADPTSGEVRIGSVPAFAGNFVAAVVDRLLASYPRIRFHIATQPLDILHRDLLDRKVDVAIAARLGPFADGSVSFEYLSDNAYVVVAGVQHPASRRRKLTLAQLAGEQWVLPPADSTIGTRFLEAFRANGLDYPQVTVIADSIDLHLNLLATGRFLSITVPSVLTFPSRRNDVVILPIQLPVVAPPVCAFTVSNRMLNPVARLFIEGAAAMAKSLPVQK